MTILNVDRIVATRTFTFCCWEYKKIQRFWKTLELFVKM